MSSPIPGSAAHAAPRSCSASRSGPLGGRLRPPGDKSMSHRAFILGLLAEGRTSVEGLLEGDDALRTGEACRALGATITRTGPGAWTIDGAGLGHLRQPDAMLDFGNAGTGTRLMMGVVGGAGISATFDGDASLRKRPMRRILDPLTLMGAAVVSEEPGGRCPIVLRGTPSPTPIRYETPVASAQIKSAILLAGLSAEGETVVVETEASRDHTEKMLRHFGADVRVEPHGRDGRAIALVGRPRLVGTALSVPADPSSAAFAIVAACIVPGSDIVVDAVMMNPLRTGLIATLREMGASIDEIDRRIEGGEDVADLRVRHASLHGVDVPAGRAPSMIDEYPVLAVAAAYAAGTTRMAGLSELRVKESDRLAAVATGLAQAGVPHRIEGDDLVVEGGAGRVAGGGFVETHLDHRIAMSFLCLGLASQKPMTIDDASMIATSYPAFRSDLAGLGAQFADSPDNGTGAGR